jgi:hypothetical protein
VSEGVSQIQYEKDIHGCLDSLRGLVNTHGLSWEQDAFHEIELLVLQALESSRSAP